MFGSASLEAAPLARGQSKDRVRPVRDRRHDQPCRDVDSSTGIEIVCKDVLEIPSTQTGMLKCTATLTDARKLETDPGTDIEANGDEHGAKPRTRIVTRHPNLLMTRLGRAGQLTKNEEGWEMNRSRKGGGGCGENRTIEGEERRFKSC